MVVDTRFTRDRTDQPNVLRLWYLELKYFIKYMSP